MTWQQYLVTLSNLKRIAPIRKQLKPGKFLFLQTFSLLWKNQLFIKYLSALDGVIQPLSERVIEWRKQTRKRDESPSITSSLASPSRRLLRKGSSTENLINKMGSVMTLSRKSRKPSRDRKDSSKGIIGLML